MTLWFQCAHARLLKHTYIRKHTCPSRPMFYIVIQAIVGFISVRCCCCFFLHFSCYVFGCSFQLLVTVHNCFSAILKLLSVATKIWGIFAICSFNLIFRFFFWTLFFFLNVPLSSYTSVVDLDWHVCSCSHVHFNGVFPFEWWKQVKMIWYTQTIKKGGQRCSQSLIVDGQ